MTDQPGSGFDCDDIVDVVCVGNSPGVMAYAIACVTADLDVLLVHAPAHPDENIAAWYTAMTSDLDPRLNPGRENAEPERQGFSLARVCPPPAPTGKRAALETFVGEHLRQWSAHCLQSPFGVMFSQVPELLVPMRTDDGQTITATLLGELGDAEPVNWLRDRARESGLTERDNIMATTILNEGRIAGVELSDGYRVATRGGLVWPTGATADLPDMPGRGGLTVAVVGRPAGRFATVDLLAQ